VTSLELHQGLKLVALTEGPDLLRNKSWVSGTASTAVLLGADCLAAASAVLLAAAALAALTDSLAPFALPTSRVSPDHVALLFVLIFSYLAAKGRYSKRMPFWTEAYLVLRASFIALAIEAILQVSGGVATPPIIALATLAVFPICATIANRAVKIGLLRAGLWNVPIVVVGTGPRGAAAEAALGTDQLLGYEIIARIDPDIVMSGGGPKRMQQLLDRHGARRLLLALDGDQDQQLRVIDCALRERVPFSIAPQPSAFPACAWETTRLFSQDAVMLSFKHGLSQPGSQLTKSCSDILLASVMLVLSSPIFLLMTLLCGLDGGPVFFSHRRIGSLGTSFKCRKFRTMVVDSDRVLAESLAADPALAAEWAAFHKLARDPRVTPIGRFLRRTSLDELPQLINVLMREMSMVGPRPIVEGEVIFYGEDIAHYYGTRPGLTGLWQVSGRSNTSYARRVQLDVWYVTNWTMWLDVAVLLKTFPAVLSRSGAR